MGATANPAMTHEPEAEQRALPDLALRPLLIIAGVVVALLIAVSERYGYHRDELYFLAAFRHLALGYVDQPPVAVLIAWLDRVAFGSSLLALRLVPALLVGVVILLSGMTTRELGGSGFGADTFGFGCLGRRFADDRPSRRADDLRPRLRPSWRSSSSA